MLTNDCKLSIFISRFNMILMEKYEMSGGSVTFHFPQLSIHLFNQLI